jgi:hypothetical protein
MMKISIKNFLSKEQGLRFSQPGGNEKVERHVTTLYHYILHSRLISSYCKWFCTTLQKKWLFSSYHIEKKRLL